MARATTTTITTTTTTRCTLFALLTLLLVATTCPIGQWARAEDEASSDAGASGAAGADDEPVTEAPALNQGPQPADDADVSFMFTRPVVGKPYEFPIGKEVHFLVGFKNKGQNDFKLNILDASFRYSLDFSYTLQNFSSHPYNRLVEPNQETTLGYTLFVNEQYAARAYGFTVNLLYSDKEGVQYQNTVFNETVSLVELDEGLDSESFFLYILLAGFAGLIGYGLNSLYIKYVNPTRRSSVKREPVAEKTANAKEVDYDWLPPSMVANLKKTNTAAGPKKATAAAN